GFSRILIGLRIAEALRLLRTIYKHVSEICWSCDFTTLSVFNRQFRSHTVMTPNSYLLKHGSLVISSLVSVFFYLSPSPHSTLSYTPHANMHKPESAKPSPLDYCTTHSSPPPPAAPSSTQ